MDALKHKPVIIFFAVLLAVMAAAYLLHSFNPPQRLPQRIDEIDNDSAFNYIIRDQQGKMLLMAGLRYKLTTNLSPKTISAIRHKSCRKATE